MERLDFDYPVDYPDPTHPFAHGDKASTRGWGRFHKLLVGRIQSLMEFYGVNAGQLAPFMVKADGARGITEQYARRLLGEPERMSREQAGNIALILHTTVDELRDSIDQAPTVDEMSLLYQALSPSDMKAVYRHARALLQADERFLETFTDEEPRGVTRVRSQRNRAKEGAIHVMRGDEFIRELEWVASLADHPSMYEEGTMPSEDSEERYRIELLQRCYASDGNGNGLGRMNVLAEDLKPPRNS